MIRLILYREKRKNLPILPQLLRDVEIMHPFDKTIQNEVFLQSDEGEDNKILIFATEGT